MKKDWRDEENWHSRVIAKFRTYTDEQLRFVIKDAGEAATAAQSLGNQKTGQYLDEVHYASAELKRRNKAAA